MAGWDKTKVARFKKGFADFLKHLRIDSKETGGRAEFKLYQAQKRFFNGIFGGLEDDIHDFTILKSRQLGITTATAALDLFWVGVHPGLQGAIVFDTYGNKEKHRLLITRYLESLPASLGFPGVHRHYAGGIVLDNGSQLDYLVAGIRKSTGSGGLGRSRGLNFLHATECSSWADEAGVASLRESLSDSYPDRLYVWESTARGFNIFNDMWEDAKADDLTKRGIFIGWWAKETQRIASDTPLFERYGQEPDETEQARIKAVKDQYGVKIDREQLAWIRHKEDPRRDPDGKTATDHVTSDLLQQEQPWTEEDAFLMTGKSFFPAEALSVQRRAAVKSNSKNYRYYMSQEFTSTVVEPTRGPRGAQLRIWEEPDPTGVYVIGADPAFGSSEDGDRYVAQVLRCYADGLDQVAEFSTVTLATYQFAWVIAHLCGAYGNARLLLELNGPGNAVWNEFRTLETLMRAGYLHETAAEMGIENLFDNVKHYLWAREATLTQNPTAFHWETTTKRKVHIMERLRDFLIVGALTVRSPECIDEMKKIVRNGDSIRGDGLAKDDRVMGMALAVQAWEQHERKRMIRDGRTRAAEAKRRQLTSADLHAIFSERLVENFFTQARADRRAAQRQVRRGSRWNW